MAPALVLQVVLEHIVKPDAEVAPYFRPQLIVTTQGKVYTGYILGKEGQSQAYIGTEGNTFTIKKSDVEERRELTTSIMPKGLLDKMDATEIRDLLSKQVTQPVLWEASVRRMIDDGIEGFLEAGTGRVLRGTLKRIQRKIPTDGFGDE